MGCGRPVAKPRSASQCDPTAVLEAPAAHGVGWRTYYQNLRVCRHDLWERTHPNPGVW